MCPSKTEGYLLTYLLTDLLIYLNRTYKFPVRFCKNYEETNDQHAAVMLNTRNYGQVPVMIALAGDPAEGTDGSGDAEVGTPVGGGEPDKQTHVEQH